MTEGLDRFSPAEIEEKVLEFWEKNKIFEKSLAKTRNGKPFTFYDGPPFATGLPHYGHILASTIKDLIPRYQTMKGRFVRRRWGWDCHGLPIEEVVERSLGISGKKQIEEIGIGKFNEICRAKVLEFASEWRKMVRRIARWIDFDNSYKTMDRDYMESVWWAFKQIHKKGLVYEGRKVLMYCPRCETPVSNFEVAMDNSYKDVTDEAVTVKFKVVINNQTQGLNLPSNVDTFLLAWTTTPWTLPGNVALAVNPSLEYGLYELGGKAAFVVSINKAEECGFKNPRVIWPGSQLRGIEYEPLFEVPAMKNLKSYKVYGASFVTADEGTGIVHTAVVYGEDDYLLGVSRGLPVVPLLDEKGKFNDKAPDFLRGAYFKDADAAIIKDLENRSGGGLIFKKEKVTHSYPHCWRCGNPLYYNAIPAWFINVQKIKKELIDSNSHEVNWFPEHLKHGRYEKSVEQAPDWNISRNRYWGNPIPVWKCENGCEPIVVGSIKELGLSTNTFYFARHGEAESNVLGIVSSYPEKRNYDLTESGIKEVGRLAEKLSKFGGVDLIFSSDLLRTRHTAELLGEALRAPVKFDERLREYGLGEYNGQPVDEFRAAFPEDDRWTDAPKGGETWKETQNRMIDFIRETDKKHEHKRILVVSHADPLWLVQKYYGSELGYPAYAEPFEISVGLADLHRPAIDEIVLKCPHCGGEARRVKEIFDSWMEAGSMPFAEYHYPFDQREVFESRLPAQFVAEYIAQTRAWFYVMHVISLILFDKAPFENVVTTGTILAEDGSKMSKSKGNYPDPRGVINKYGADSLRFYLMNSVVMQADNFNFSVKDLESVGYRTLSTFWNVWNYFKTYARESGWRLSSSHKDEPKPLDRWILARTKKLVAGVTDGLDGYNAVSATRSIIGYVDDLSTWYLRRSRGRKDESFFSTLFKVLLTTSQIIAPFTPYIGEAIYLGLREFNEAGAESVHLTDWPKKENVTGGEQKLIEDMAVIREAAYIGQAMRKALNIPVRQPLSRLSFGLKDNVELSDDLKKIILEELNVKKFDPHLSREKGESVKSFPGNTLIPDFHLDIAVSEDLKTEGRVRNLERAIQDLRKKNGFRVGEEAVLIYELSDPSLKKSLELFDRQKTFIKGVEEKSPAEKFDAELSLEIDNIPLWLGLRKI